MLRTWGDVQKARRLRDDQTCLAPVFFGTSDRPREVFNGALLSTIHCRTLGTILVVKIRGTVRTAVR